MVFLCALAACAAFTCCGGEPAAPEINWEQIEAWATGDAVVLTPKKMPEAPKTDVKPTAPAVTKTEPPPPEAKPAVPVKLPSRVTEAKDYLEMRAKYAMRANALLKIDEAEKRYDRAFDVAYRAEYLPKAMEMVSKIASDKRYQCKEYELWVAGKVWELGYQINLPQSHIQNAFRIWKEKITKAIEQNLITDQGLADRLQVPRDANRLAQREAYFNSLPGLFEELRIQELKGESDPKLLWELAMRYAGDSPSAPMKYMAQLYRLRERFPDCDQVKSGDVQVAIARYLSDVLWMPQDAAEEAVVAMEKFKQHGAVASGDMCWMAAQNYNWYAGELKTNKDALEQYRKSHHYLVEMNNYPKNGNNKPFTRPGEQRALSEVQRRLDEVTSNIRRRE